MNIPSNFTLDEILRLVYLPESLRKPLANCLEAHRQELEELKQEELKQYKEIERLEEVQSNAENLVYELEKELKCKDFRYTETKNLVKILTDLIENCNIEV